MAIDSINSNAINSPTLKQELNPAAPNSSSTELPTSSQNTPELQSAQRIEDQKLSGEILNRISSEETLNTVDEVSEAVENPIKDFISNTLITWTTASSALVNLLSAPVRLFHDDDPLKKIINHISMFFTKAHLGAYSVAGLISAIEQKNPLLIFSFFTEGIAAFMNLRNIYLFRGIATGIDGAVAGIKDKHKRSNFSSYSEGWQHSIQTIQKSFKDFGTKFAKDPWHLFKLDGSDIAIFASLLASVGGVMGMTINEKIGGAIRDISGAVGDYGIFKLDNPLAKSAGFLYLGGSILDLAARVFNKGVAAILGVNNPSAFEKLRDAFHECAIAFDRGGQYFFLRYNQQDNKKLQAQKRDDHKGFINSLKNKRIVPESSPGVELAKERNFASAA